MAFEPRYKFITLNDKTVAQAVVLVDIDGNIVNTLVQIQGTVDTFNDLPEPATHLNEFWLVRESSGLYLLNRKERGLYISNGTTWLPAPDIIPFFNDANLRIFNGADNTKLIKFDASLISTNNTRIITMADRNVDLKGVPALGTAQGQFLFWDETLGQWVNTEISELIWDDTNKRLGIGEQSPMSKLNIKGGEIWCFYEDNNPRILIGDTPVSGQYGYLQWDSANNYFRIETIGTNGLKINDNYISIGNIFPSRPLTIGIGIVEQFRSNTDRTHEIGDIAGGNFSKFEVDGTLTFNGDAVVWRDENFDSVSTGAGSSPAYINLDTTLIKVPSFPINQTKELNGHVELAHSYKEGTNLVPHVHFNPTTTGAGTVIFYLRIYIRKGTTVLYDSVISASIAVNGNAWEEIKLDFAEIIGTTFTIGAQVSMRIYRSNADPGTYVDPVVITTWGYHHQIDTIGSRQITTK